MASVLLAHYRALASLDGLGGLPHLNTLKISGARKLVSLEPIGGLAGLETLELERLGSVPSLQFLLTKSLERLRKRLERP